MTNDPRTLPISAEELQRHIDELGRVGDDPQRGRWRAPYTPAWQHSIDLVRSWMEEAGLETRVDAVGNLYGRLEGREQGLSILTGSHIDTVPQGGKYDGQLGILAALAAVKALKQAFGDPRAAIEVVAICDEEGSRFNSDYWGSRAIVRGIDPRETEQHIDASGVTLATAMRSVNLDPARVGDARRDDVGTWLELHIEQGRILETEGMQIGIVHTIAGARLQRVRVMGRQDHAGSTPMDLRKDAVLCAAEMIRHAIGVARDMGRPTVCTVGQIVTEPGEISAVPASVTFTLDMRDAESTRLAQLTGEIDRFNRDAAARHNLPVEIVEICHHEPVPMSSSLLEILEQEANRVGVKWIRMPSMATHDAVVMAERWPSVMIFVPSQDGRSHARSEYTPIEEIMPGVHMLALALYRLSFGSSSCIADS